MPHFDWLADGGAFDIRGMLARLSDREKSDRSG
jgi:hypothetical protein